MPIKEITNQELAKMIYGLGKELKKRDKQVDKRFDKLEKKMEQNYQSLSKEISTNTKLIDDLATAVITEFRTLENEFEKVYNRFDKQDREFQEIFLKLPDADYKNIISDLQNRVSVLEFAFKKKLANKK
jgi:DNA anti-recombination protein RmuC